MLAMLQSPPPPIKLSLHRLAFRDYIKESLEKQEVFQNFSAFFAYFLPRSSIVEFPGKNIQHLDFHGGNYGGWIQDRYGG
jgi:hypothetical protein